MLYPVSLLFFGVCAAVLAVVCWRGMGPERIDWWVKVPRNVAFGTILAGIDLLWCVPHVEPVFYIGARSWLVPLALGLIFVAYYFLDYHFARALAAFVILLSHYFLQESFATDPPMLWLFSLAVFVMGTAAIFVGGMPYLLRDFFRKLCGSRPWRRAMAAVCAVYALVGFGFGVVALARL